MEGKHTDTVVYLQELQQALRFYADPLIYQDVSFIPANATIAQDRGALARMTLGLPTAEEVAGALRERVKDLEARMDAFREVAIAFREWRKLSPYREMKDETVQQLATNSDWRTQVQAKVEWALRHMEGAML
jgi:hypothetical protein